MRLQFLCAAVLVVAPAAVVAQAKDSAALKSSSSKDQLEHCAKPFGILAVNEPQQQYMQIFTRYQLGSPAALLRMMAQQSNCFVVVERGAGMQNIQQERQLARSGEMQSDANMGGGQMKAADFVMTAAVQVANNNAGGIGGAIGGLGGGLIGGAGVRLKFKEAETSLLLADSRTTVQVAAAEGKAKKTDFSLGALGWGGGMVAAGAGYTNTAEGKVIAASYLDNFNALVGQMKGNGQLMARADKFTMEGTSGADTKGGAAFNEGDVLHPKIDNVKLLSDPKDDAKLVIQLKKGDELVYLGKEEGGYLKVQGSNGEGWVKKTLVQK